MSSKELENQHHQTERLVICKPYSSVGQGPSKLCEHSGDAASDNT